MTDDNIIYFSKEQPNIDKIDASAVEVLCDIAGRNLDDVVILGIGQGDRCYQDDDDTRGCR